MTAYSMNHDDEVGSQVRMDVRPAHHGREPRCPTARELLAPAVSDRVPEASAAAGPRASAIGGPTTWTENAQERALDILRQRELNPWKPFYCHDPQCDGEPHAADDGWDFPHARADQRPPSMREEWLTWLLAGGRGSGKTRTGSEATHRMSKKVPRLRLIAPTGTDFRDTMVEGESGILMTSPPDSMPEYEPSKRRLTWPNGCVGTGYSGEEPDRLRGSQSYWDWIDEPAHMPLIGGEYGVWDNMLFGLRLGRRPWICATTTPKNTKWMKTTAKDPLTRVVRVATYANLGNLAPTFRRTILDRYEGTRVGRQELHGEILEDIDGAMWTVELIRYVEQLPAEFDRIVIGIDPAGTKNHRSDLTGLIAVAYIYATRTVYVLEDRSDKYTPSGWASEAVSMYEKWSADALVPEKNFGADMVTEVLEKNGAENIRIIPVHSRRGKALRAEPVVALYEKLRVLHVKGATPDLEDEQLSWVPGQGDSPNRVDALVHAITELAKLGGPADIASPADLGDDFDLNMPTMSSAVRAQPASIIPGLVSAGGGVRSPFGR